MTAQAQRTAAVSAVVFVVVAAIGYGLYVAGSPSEARLRRLDERRVQDLRSLRSLTDAYWAREGRLPTSLQELRSTDTAGFRDPVSGEPYRYRTTSDSTYELCARFDRPAENGRLGPLIAFWRHGQGEHCYPLKARKEGGPLLP